MLINIDISAGNQAEKQVCDYEDQLPCTSDPMKSEIWKKPEIHPFKLDFNMLKSDDLDMDYINFVHCVENHHYSPTYCLTRKNN